MPEDSAQYLVLKCKKCDFFFGKHKKSKLSCPRCGEIKSKKDIFGRANNTEELHELVSLNNIPEELREGFSKLNKKRFEKTPIHKIKDLIPFILSESVNDEGVILLDELNKTIRKNNYKISSEKIIEIAESEGLLLRLSKENWELLG